MEILFVNGKGGVGKSTLCYLLSLALKEAGKSVFVKDLDPQQSLGQYFSEQEFTEDSAEFILVDSMPVINDPIVKEAIARADCSIVPCSPDPFSLAVTISSSEVVKNLMRADAKAFGVLNDVETGTNLSKAAPEILRENLHIPLLPVQIPHRQAIKRAAFDGWKGLDQDVREAVFKLALETIA